VALFGFHEEAVRGDRSLFGVPVQGMCDGEWPSRLTIEERVPKNLLKWLRLTIVAVIVSVTVWVASLIASFLPAAPVPFGGALIYVLANWVKPAEGGVERLMNVYVSMGVTPPIAVPSATETSATKPAKRRGRPKPSKSLPAD
jgi:hypothetical protein